MLRFTAIPTSIWRMPENVLTHVTHMIRSILGIILIVIKTCATNCCEWRCNAKAIKIWFAHSAFRTYCCLSASLLWALSRQMEGIIGLSARILLQQIHNNRFSGFFIFRRQSTSNIPPGIYLQFYPVFVHSRHLLLGWCLHAYISELWSDQNLLCNGNKTIMKYGHYSIGRRSWDVAEN